VALGILLMAAWPRPALVATQAESPFGGAAVATFIASAIWLWRTERRYALQVEMDASRTSESEPADSPQTADAASQPAPDRNESFAAGLITVVVLVGLSIALLAARAATSASDWPTYLVAGVFVVVFAAMVRTGAHPR